MKDFSYYSSVPVKYPDRAAIREKHVAPIAEQRLTERERKQAIERAEVAAKDEYDSILKAYLTAERLLEDEFWADMREEHGYAEWLGEDGIAAIENYAYQRGHSAGYSEVNNVMYDIAEMVDKCVNSALKKKGSV